MEARHEILKFILDGKDLEDDSSDESQVDYIDKLCSIGIHSLEREPNRLIDENIRLEEAIKEEAIKNYPCFLEASEFSQNFKEEFDNIEDKLDHFIDTIPVFKDKLSTFSDEAKGITKRWRQASLMLAKHNQLLEFLEIPQLMDSCVRKGYYEEALQLYFYIQRIDRRFGKEIPLVQTIADELAQCKEVMIGQLLKELYSNIQLPSAIKIISYLRRINVYDETELRIKFLSGRDAWLKSLIKDIPTTNPLIYMSKLIEIYRINLFDIVTQYRALFADDISVHTVPPKLTAESVLSPSNDRDFGDESILTSWISNKIDIFLSQLEETLENCIKTEYSSLYPIENLFDPCFYFGLSMSRIGADFRPLLSSIFQRVVLTKFSQTIEKAVKKFESNMENFSLSSSASLLTTSTSESSVSDTDKANFDPPSVIFMFPPLCGLCNDLLESLNQVRKMIPLTLIFKFRDILNSNLTKASEILWTYYKTESTSVANQEMDLLKKMIEIYVYHLVPHIQKCLNALAPVQSLTKILGLSALEYNRLKKNNKNFSFSDLDLEAIKKPIGHLL